MDWMLEPVMQFVRRRELCWLPFEDLPMHFIVANLKEQPRKQLAEDWRRRYDAAVRDPELWFNVLPTARVNTWLTRAKRPPLPDTHPDTDHLIVINAKVLRDG